MRKNQDMTVLKVALLPAFILTAIAGAISMLAVSIADTHEARESRVRVAASVAPTAAVASVPDAGAARPVQAY